MLIYFIFSEGNGSNISVYNLEGSIFKWANEKRSLIDSKGQSTVFVHPYNFLYGKLLKSEFRKWPDSK